MKARVRVISYVSTVQKLEEAQRQLAIKQRALAEARAKLREV